MITDLTERQKDILALIMASATNQEIADKLGISYETVRTNVRRLLTATGAAKRQQLALWGQQAAMSGQPLKRHVSGRAASYPNEDQLLLAARRDAQAHVQATMDGLCRRIESLTEENARLLSKLAAANTANVHEVLASVREAAVAYNPTYGGKHADYIVRQVRALVLPSSEVAV